MWTDISELREFYAGAMGRVARACIGHHIRELWEDLRGEKLAGIGYATPYLSGYRAAAERVIAFMPARQGVVNWPSGATSASAMVNEDDLPLVDGAVERILLAHCLEHAEFPADVLREAARVLAPGGRLIVVTPNRRGLWARSDNSPFGNGRPFSRTQLATLLKETGFAPANWREALFVPPLNRFGLLRASRLFERIGGTVPIMFGGVLIVEAQKQFSTLQPIRAGERLRAGVRALPQPVPSSRSALRG